MPAPVFPTAYQVEVRGHLFGQEVENVWHVLGDDPFDAGVASGVAGIFQTAYAAIMDPLSQDYTVNEIFVHNLAGTASGEFTLAVIPAQAGGQPVGSEPGNVAFCVSLRTALAGRRFRGRKYFAGIPTGSVVANLLDVDIANEIVTQVAILMANLAANSTPMCVFSPTGLTLTTVTAITYVDLVVDSQRRRLTGRGR